MLVIILGVLPLIGPWFCSAAVALVILQQGLQEGLKILLWALLPAGAWFYIGDPSFLMMLLAGCVAAAVLREVSSLPIATTVIVLVTVVEVALVFVLRPEHLDAFIAMMSDALVASLEKQASSGQAASGQLAPGDIDKMVKSLVSVAFAWGAGISACLVLFLARWWQALLFKPGGFQSEFHQYRLGYRTIFMLLLVFVVVWQIPEFGMSLAALSTIPLLVGAVALVHGLVKIINMSSHWLGMFYVSLFFMGHLIYVPLLMLATLDASIDIRTKVSESIEGDDGSES